MDKKEKPNDTAGKANAPNNDEDVKQAGQANVKFRDVDFGAQGGNKKNKDKGKNKGGK